MGLGRFVWSAIVVVIGLIILIAVLKFLFNMF